MKWKQFSIRFALLLLSVSVSILGCDDDSNSQGGDISDLSTSETTCSEGETNACGGCGPLVGVPGEPCTNCGTWACDSLTSVTCVPPINVPGTECTVDGCVGAYQCGSDGLVVCASSSVNACGLCEGPVVSGLGLECESTSGCKGTTVCSADGTTAVCDAPAVNECGVCGGLPLDGLGESCTNTDDCVGVNVCNTSGDALVCDAPSKNECDVCGPPVTGLNEACTATGGCAGTTGCDSTGTSAICLAPDTNSCGVCSADDPPDLGNPCTNDAGCTGVFVCDESGTGSLCNAAEANACGVCGGLPVSGIGDSCYDARGCSGQMGCNANGDDTICVASACSSSGVVFSEVSGGNGSALDPLVAEPTDEFIELYNSSAQTLDIGGLTLWGRTATGENPPYVVFVIPLHTTIPSHHYLLLGKRPGQGGSPGYIGPPALDFSYTAIDLSYSSSAGQQLWLTLTEDSVPSDPAEVQVVDMIGWGSANVFEGTIPAPDHPALGGSLERKAVENSTGWDGDSDHGTMGPSGADANAGNGYDSDRNGYDFVQRQTRQPQNSSSPAE